MHEQPIMDRRRFLGGTAAASTIGVLGGLRPGSGLAQVDAGVVERLADDLVTHASFGQKFSGGPGDNANADWIAGRLRALDYDVVESNFDAPFFVNRRSTIASGSHTTEVIAQAPVVPTTGPGITARLALIEADNGRAGNVGDVRGRIAVVVAPFGRHAALFPTRGFGPTVIAAADAGAAAIVIVTSGPSGEAVALNCPEEPFVPVPAAVLAPKNATAMVVGARAGDEGTLVIDGDPTARPCRNIVARLERGPRWLAISTPRSGWFQCVAERGTGTAAFLEIADWARARFPEHSIFLMNTGGHEYFFAGSHRVLHEAPAPEATVAWMHIGATLAARDAVEDGGSWTMLDTADPQRRVMATASAAGPAEAAFAGLSGMSPPGEIQSQAGELSTFTGMGYTTAFAALGVHRWFHTTSDTLDCVDAALLAPVVRAHQRTLELIAA